MAKQRDSFAHSRLAKVAVGLQLDRAALVVSSTGAWSRACVGDEQRGVSLPW